MAINILLLEDDIQLSDTIKQFLTLKGYEVFTAYDGVHAEDVVYENHIDLMLLDVKVPLLSGFDFLKQLRENGKDIPALFITSLNSVEDVERGFELGCHDYIRKPFALKELAVRIDAILKRIYDLSDEQVKIDDEFSFDMKKFILSKNDQKIPLKTKELKLLSLFLQQSDKLLNYDTINETLWDYDEAPSSGSLRTYIKNLRSILGKHRIETVKNMGYRFVK
jgi:two-component system OmpR family response regulator